MSKEETKEELLKELEVYTSTDSFGLKPETLYKNIAGSTGSVKQLVKFFDVSEELILKILENEDKLVV